MNASSESSDLLWKQYALHADLYKFYLELTIKVNVFYYAVTGAILSYFFQHPGDGLARYALALPIVTSLALGGVFWYGSTLIAVVRQEMFDIRDALNLSTAPEYLVLTVFLRVMGSILVIVGLALGWYVLASSLSDTSTPSYNPMKVYMIAAVALQVIGTVILALFSFFGITINKNDAGYLIGMQDVAVNRAWLNAARLGLVLVVAGIVLSGILGYSGAG